jgi:hypothetical protein
LGCKTRHNGLSAAKVRLWGVAQTRWAQTVRDAFPAPHQAALKPNGYRPADQTKRHGEPHKGALNEQHQFAHSG